MYLKNGFAIEGARIATLAIFSPSDAKPFSMPAGSKIRVDEAHVGFDEDLVCMINEPGTDNWVSISIPCKNRADLRFVDEANTKLHANNKLIDPFIAR